MELLIIWMLFAGLVGFIASQKGRNVIGWAVVGGAFGIFGLVAILASKDISDYRVDK